MESGVRDCRVMVCDDTESIRRLIRINLELEGHQVREAASARVLVDTLRDPDVELPDVILLDAHMAPRDGWWAIGEIRAHARLADIPVVLVTAAIHGLDEGIVEEAGFDAVLGKPFDPDDLLDVVSRVRLQDRQTSRPS